MLASAAGYRGRRLRLSLCTQALERTRVEYEQPQGPARTLRIVFNCSSVAAKVARADCAGLVALVWRPLRGRAV